MTDEDLAGEFIQAVAATAAEHTSHVPFYFWLLGLKSSPAYERLQKRWPAPDLSGVILHSGVFELAARGAALHPATLVKHIERFAGKPRSLFPAIEAWGIQQSQVRSVDLGAGFHLRNFSADELSAWAPINPQEQPETEVLRHYSFVVGADQPLGVGPRMWSSNAPLVRVRNEFWESGQWRPFLVLNLFFPSPILPGVKLAVSPGWSFSQSGDFDGSWIDADPEGDQEEAYWIRQGRQHELSAPEEARLADFAKRVGGIVNQLLSSAEQRGFQSAVRAFLRASTLVPRFLNTRSLDVDDLEDCLFDLVRAADGLLADRGRRNGGDRRSLTQIFIDRIGIAAQLDDAGRQLASTAYTQRSQLAHALDEPPVTSDLVLRLWPMVRRVFITYLGAISESRFERALELVPRLEGRLRMPREVEELQNLVLDDSPLRTRVETRPEP